MSAKSDYLVTRDRDLLSLGVYERIQMVTPEAFMGMLRGERKG
jgi:predicted nucleic acid-binding protein